MLATSKLPAVTHHDLTAAAQAATVPQRVVSYQRQAIQAIQAIQAMKAIQAVEASSQQGNAQANISSP
jgi:hypothetical protein